MLPPKQPLVVPHGTTVGNLEPVSIAPVMLQLIVGRTRQVDLRRAWVPEHAVLPVAVPRNAEPYLRPGEYIGRLSLGSEIEGPPAAGDVRVVDVCLLWRLGEFMALGIASWRVVERGGDVTGEC
jgi:hypothetical protein